MRLVTWNVCDGFRRKFGHLERLQPDLAVVQEVRPECLEYAGLQARSIWTGVPGQKGLAVISYGAWTLAADPIGVAEKWFLPVRATNGTMDIALTGVWVNSSPDYVSPTLRALDQLRAFIAAPRSILVGDFNQTVVMDKGTPAGRRFADVLKVLDAYGLVSAWHKVHGEAHGAETSPTLFWQWNPEKQFHIDFSFATSDLPVSQAILGSYDQYITPKISDHMPLAVDYAT